MKKSPLGVFFSCLSAFSEISGMTWKKTPMGVFFHVRPPFKKLAGNQEKHLNLQGEKSH